MSPEVKLSKTIEDKLKQTKDLIATLSLNEIRILDIALKERKQELVNNGLEQATPSVSLTANVIGGREYIYFHIKENGRKVSQKLKEGDLPTFDFETAKISPKAKEVLREKYKIDV